MHNSTAQHSTAQQRNYSIDTLKFFCALLVVFIHTGGPFSIDIINRVAVPCFFVISGFFLYRKDPIEMQDRLVLALKNICIITLWSTIMYAIIAFGQSLYGVPSDNTVTFISAAKRVVALMFFNSPIWGFHLWYLFAYIYTLIAVWVICKLKLLKPLYSIIPILLSVSVFGGLYSHLILDSIQIPLMCTRNFLFVGIPYFLIGMLINKYDRQIFKSNTIIWIGFFMSIVLSACEYIINPRALGFGSGDLYLTTAPMTISIFLLAISIKQTKDNILSKIGRDYSLYIYIFHLFIMMILGKLCSLFLTENTHLYDFYKWSYSILVFLCAIIGSILFRATILPVYKKIIARIR